MLALSRKQGESILIGDDIELTVVQVRGNRVKVAIQAPKELKIWRKELASDSQKPKRAAS